VEVRASASATASLLDGLLDFARVDWSENKNVITQVKLQEVIAESVQLSRRLDSQRTAIKRELPCQRGNKDGQS